MTKDEPILRIEAFHARYMANVPMESADHALLILKGHLLAEEVISEYVIRNLPHSEHLSLEKNYWGFANKLDLAMSVSDDERHDKWVWNAIRLLNRIRNKYGHRLEPHRTDQLELKLIATVKKHTPSAKDGLQITLTRAILLLLISLFVICDRGKT